MRASKQLVTPLFLSVGVSYYQIHKQQQPIMPARGKDDGTARLSLCPRQGCNAGKWLHAGFFNSSIDAAGAARLHRSRAAQWPPLQFSYRIT
jgi:hypothetical protein